jgi:hypothetical protein
MFMEASRGARAGDPSAVCIGCDYCGATTTGGHPTNFGGDATGPEEPGCEPWHSVTHDRLNLSPLAKNQSLRIEHGYYKCSCCSVKCFLPLFCERIMACFITYRERQPLLLAGAEAGEEPEQPTKERAHSKSPQTAEPGGSACCPSAQSSLFTCSASRRPGSVAQ